MREGELSDDTVVVAVQNTVPIGDGNATDLAEVGHVNLLRSYQAATPDTLGTYRAPIPAGRTMQTVMVDDNVFTQIRKRRRSRRRRNGYTEAEALEGDRLVRASLQAYADAGLAAHPTKCKLQQV